MQINFQQLFICVLSSIAICFSLSSAQAGWFGFFKKSTQHPNPTVVCDVVLEPGDSEFLSKVKTYQLKIDEVVMGVLSRMVDGQKVTVPLTKIWDQQDQQNSDIQEWEKLLGVKLEISEVEFAVNVQGTSELTVIAEISSLEQREQLLNILMQDRDISVTTMNRF